MTCLLGRIRLIDFVWVDVLLTPMELACLHGNPWCVVALIAHGADVNGTERNKTSVNYRPIHYACMGKSNPETLHCVRMLIQRGADFSPADSNGDLPIQHAAIAGNVEVVEYLLKLGASVDCKGPNKTYTPLVWACCMPSLEDFQKARKQTKDASSERPEEREETREGSEDLTSPQAQAQAQAQADSEAAKEDDFLKRTIPKAQIHQLIHVLLKHGADVNHVVESFTNCLSMAARFLFLERVLILLANGAHVNNPRCPEYQCIVKTVVRASSENTVQTEEFYTMLSLLLAAGAKMSLESFENEIYPLLESCCEQASELAVYQLLQHYAAAPPPLKLLCRVKIRGLLPCDVDVSTKRLPLPDFLRGYLRFEDIVPGGRVDI